MPDLASAVALVTGAGSGIGKRTADLLEGAGATVWRTDIAGTAPLHLDVTSPRDWDAVIKLIIERTGRLDVLVNAAGIASGSGPSTIAEVSIDHWRRVFAVNVEGTLLGCQQALSVMGKHRPGTIVNIASTAAVAPSPALAAYGASKAAVVQITKTVAAAAASADLRLRCNCVLPGMADTPMTGEMPKSYRDAWEAQIPARRFANPDEIARAIIFLASDASSYVNGSGLRVDGGLLSRPVIKVDRR